MFPSLLLSLREGIEAALIIGIIIGALTKLHQEELKPVVWRGVAIAVVLSLVFGFGLNYIGMEFEGQFEEVFEGIAMLLAAAILTWMILWMQRHGSQMQQELEAKTTMATKDRSGSALFVLAFLAVFREGVELAIFLLAIRAASNPSSVLIGAALGLGSAIFLGWMIFASTRKLKLRQFFQITNVLLLFFAAGLVALGVHELNEAGWIPPIIENVWNMNHIISDTSEVGLLLKALFGYNGNPSLSEVFAYLGYFLILGAIILKNQRRPMNRKAITA
ncbi:MAG: FTR1 family protein [Chloroflexota bacterium]|nr:MAG: FTR1 family protein [Chloroflexota bacterium]